MFHVINKYGITVAVLHTDSLEGIEVDVPEGGKIVEGLGILLGRGNEPRPGSPGDDYEFDEESFSWKIPITNLPALEAEAKRKRQMLLLASDWTQLPDVPLETKTAWATYRQALRDITSQPGFPVEITWPTPPV